MSLVRMKKIKSELFSGQIDPFLDINNVRLEFLVGINQVVNSSAGVQNGSVIFPTTMHTNIR